MTEPRFPLGQVVATPGALAAFGPSVLRDFLSRHARGDWGNVPPEDAAENWLSVDEGLRVLSAYSVGDQKVWIITEADRSSTTVLLPDEY